MKRTTIMILLFLFITCEAFGSIYIILFDCSGSFIGKNAPEILRTGALQKINELTLSMKEQDTLIFIPIRENSTISSLHQIVLFKESEKRIYDKTAERKNNLRMKNFARAILKEINQKPSDKTDIVSAINFAGSIAKLSNDATIIVLSDGDDNVNSSMFNNLKRIKIFHLFVYTPSSDKINNLLEKWENLYSKLGVDLLKVLDAQSSLNYNLRIGR